MPAQLPAVHAGHYQIGQHQVNGALIGLADLQGFVAVLGFQDLIAALAENPGGHFPHSAIVLHQQDGFMTPEIGIVAQTR